MDIADIIAFLQQAQATHGAEIPVYTEGDGEVIGCSIQTINSLPGVVLSVLKAQK